MMTITKLQCMLDSKQERIAALERQVEDLLQDRKFLRTQIENLTSSRSLATFTPAPEGECAGRPVFFLALGVVWHFEKEHLSNNPPPPPPQDINNFV